MELPDRASVQGEEPQAPLNELADLLRGRFDASGIDSETSVVLIVGAGASIESGMPTWEDPELRRKLVEAVSAAYGGTRAYVEEAWQQLARSLPPVAGRPSPEERLDFLIRNARTDQLCAVACRLQGGRTALLDFLDRRYGWILEEKKQGHDPPSDRRVRPPPQLAYELIAHLVKHRFIDHIISLNFDEVLDVALEDELGRNGYQTFLPGQTIPQPSRTLPCLFKLHGTISQRESLRFSAEATGTIAAPTDRLLDQFVLGAEAGKTREQETDTACLRQVAFVSLGYSWEDADLRWWVARNSEHVRQLIVVSKDHEPAARLRKTLGEAARRGKIEASPVHSIATASIVNQGEDAATVDEVLWAVWLAVREDESGKLDRIPSAARHLLISHFFPSSSGHRTWPAVYEKHDERARFEAEVLLVCGKTDGMLTVSAVANDSRLAGHCEEFTGEKSPPADEKRPPLDKLKFTVRNQYPDVTDVYFFDGSEKDYLSFFRKRSNTRLPFSEQNVRDCTDASIAVPGITSTGRLDRALKDYYEFLEKYLTKVLNGASVEVDPAPDARVTMLLKSPKQLPTYEAMRRETEDLLKDDSWSTLLMIAEAGEWLQKEAERLRERGQKVLLIDASMFGLDGWKLGRPQREQVDGVLRVGTPWWVHNRHLTLALSRKGGLHRAIYFRRRQRAQRISPVAVRDGKDLEELLKIFLSYAARFYEEFAGWPNYDPDGVYQPVEFFDALVELNLSRLLDNDDADEGWTRRLREAHEKWRITRVVTDLPVDPDIDTAAEVIRVVQGIDWTEVKGRRQTKPGAPPQK